MSQKSVTTTTGSDRPLILYFEDDHQVATMTIEFLQHNGYQISHFDSCPSDDISEITNTLIAMPVLTILDINMPGIDGYQVCRQLRSHFLTPQVPVIFTSGLMETADIVKAFDSGGNDYLVKPVRLAELKVKIVQQIQQMTAAASLNQQLESAQDMAFAAMTASSEYGSILQFHEQCTRINDHHQLAQSLLTLCRQFGLRSSAMILSEQPVYLSDSGQLNDLEHKTMQILRQKPRIYSWGNRTIFNYNDLSLLVLNMPIDNETRCGELLDIVCLILNGVQARMEAIAIHDSERHKQQSISETATGMSQLMMSMEQRKIDLSGRFERIIINMAKNIADDIVQFSLLENEEKVIMAHIHQSMEEAQVIFDESADSQKQYQQQVTQLLKRLQ